MTLQGFPFNNLSCRQEQKPVSPRENMQALAVLRSGLFSVQFVASFGALQVHPHYTVHALHMWC